MPIFPTAKSMQSMPSTHSLQPQGSIMEKCLAAQYVIIVPGSPYSRMRCRPFSTGIFSFSRCFFGAVFCTCLTSACTCTTDQLSTNTYALVVQDCIQEFNTAFRVLELDSGGHECSQGFSTAFTTASHKRHPVLRHFPGSTDSNSDIESDT